MSRKHIKFNFDDESGYSSSSSDEDCSSISETEEEVEEKPFLPKKRRLEGPVTRSQVKDMCEESSAVHIEDKQNFFVLDFQNWTQGGDKEDNDEYESWDDIVRKMRKDKPIEAMRLKAALKTIETVTPSLDDVLKIDIEDKDRGTLLEIMEAIDEMQNSNQPYKMEIIALRKSFNDMRSIFIDKKKKKDLLSKKEKEIFKTNLHKVTTLVSRGDLATKILNLNADIDTIREIYQKYKHSENLSSHDEEKNKTEQWVQKAIKLPFNNFKSLENNNILRILSLLKESLDKELYGMREVKERMLTYVNMCLMNPKGRKQTLGLCGPPGTGKTCIVRALAKVFELPFAQISCGGIKDVNNIKGFSSTYIGSRPGLICDKLSQLKVKNGIFFLDEFEKIDSVEISNAFLHILDPAQNKEYIDNYFSPLKIDLSQIWWVCSMNSYPKDLALRDRIQIIEVKGYNKKEKIDIINQFLIPRYNNNTNYPISSINADGIDYMIEKFSPKISGVRTLDALIQTIIKRLSLLFSIEESQEILPLFDIRPLPLDNILTLDNIKKLTKDLLTAEGSDSPPTFMYM